MKMKYIWCDTKHADPLHSVLLSAGFETKQNVKYQIKGKYLWSQFPYHLTSNNNNMFQWNIICDSRQDDGDELGSWRPIKYLSILCKWQDIWCVDSTIHSSESIPQARSDWNMITQENLILQDTVNKLSWTVSQSFDASREQNEYERQHYKVI